MGEPATFFRYEDAHGRAHMVDSLEAVPKPLRKNATRIQMSAPDGQSSLGDKLDDVASDLAGRAELQVYKATEITHGALNRTPVGSWLHAPTVGGGLGALLGVGLLFLLWRRRGGLWLRLLLGFVSVGLLGGAYLGWVRGQAGLGGDTLTSPQVLIEDAQRAVERVNERQRASEESLLNADRQ